ncbi:alcohol dehydrogenase catalytic domain-containing protein [Phytohabitans flavus]|uniref:alcohol dehydrogenase catalytic domain-containing protein n=1 Tax=Phytohabitans flavus TaxID=1076124 RepID=UPI0036334ED9
MTVPTPVLTGARTPHRLLDLEVDEPRDGEVRVRMAASGVCHSCLYAMDGEHAAIPMPIVLGDEGAGVVEAVGPGSPRWHPATTSSSPGHPAAVAAAPAGRGCPRSAPSSRRWAGWPTAPPGFTTAARTSSTTVQPPTRR